MGFLSKVFKNILPSIAGAALGSFIPGLGTALGASLGGAISGARKGGLTGALTGGLSGYGIGSLGSSLGSMLSTPAQAGLLTQGAIPVGSAIDLSSGLGNLGGTAIDLSSATVPLSISGGSSMPLSNLGGGSLGSGASTGLGSRLKDIFGSGGGTDNASLLKNLYSGIQGTQTYDDLAKAQLMANQQAASNLSPYATTGASANDRLAALLGLTGDDNEDMLSTLRQTPGYQFRMEEGQNALDRGLGARGKYFSGEAIKESQRFGQGLADQTYNDVLKNLANQSSQGYGAASGLGALDLGAGDIEANKILGKSNLMNEILANLGY